MKKRSIWSNVIPVATLLVILGLVLAMYWFSPANQQTMTANVRALTPLPTMSNNEYATLIAQEYNLTPNANPQVFHLEEGEHTLYFYGREPGTLLDKIEIVPAEEYYAELTATAAVWTPTPVPICTPVLCESGQYHCPSGDCVGGCGLVCAENTPTVTPTLPIDYEIVETNVNVRVYWRGLGSDGKPKDLNERHTHSLYNFSDGYRLPHCDFMPNVDLNECSQEPTFLLYVIRVTDGLPYDVGYWGAINENTWIALYIERSDTWYTDWRPPGWQSSL